MTRANIRTFVEKTNLKSVAENRYRGYSYLVECSCFMTASRGEYTMRNTSDILSLSSDRSHHRNENRSGAPVRPVDEAPATVPFGAGMEYFVDSEFLHTSQSQDHVGA